MIHSKKDDVAVVLMGTQGEEGLCAHSSQQRAAGRAFTRRIRIDAAARAARLSRAVCGPRS